MFPAHQETQPCIPPTSLTSAEDWDELLTMRGASAKMALVAAARLGHPALTDVLSLPVQMDPQRFAKGRLFKASNLDVCYWISVLADEDAVSIDTAMALMERIFLENHLNFTRASS